MNEEMNTPVSPEPAGISSWVEIWINAVTKPSEQLYASMSEHSDAQSYSRAFIWVFVAGTLAAIISGLLRGILDLAGLSAATPIPGMSDFLGNGSNGGLGGLALALCTSPISGAVGVLFFAIFVGIVQWVAKMFKGVGNFSQLAYVMAAISVPFTLITSFLTPFSTVNVVMYCTTGISLLLGLYALYLQLLAVKAVNKFGWGEAAGSYFLPLVLIGCICGCVVAGMASMFGLAFGDLLNQGF